MAAKKQRNEENEIYEDVAEAADFIHDRLGVEGALGLNNTVEEYMEEEEGKE